MKGLLLIILVYYQPKCSCTKAESSLTVGQKAPTFIASDQNGDQFKSSETLKGEQLIVAFL